MAKSACGELLLMNLNNRIPKCRVPKEKHIYHYVVQCSDCGKIYRIRKRYEGFFIEPEVLLERLGLGKVCQTCRIRGIINNSKADIKEEKDEKKCR